MMAELAKTDIGKSQLGFAAGEERSMPLPVLADGNPFAFEHLEQAGQI